VPPGAEAETEKIFKEEIYEKKKKIKMLAQIQKEHNEMMEKYKL